MLVNMANTCVQTGFAVFFPFDPMGMRNTDKELKEIKVRQV